jgi:poly(U)-specific endoribonuclease
VANDNVFQQIWDADRTFAGVKAILAGTPITSELTDSGYVVVDPGATGDQNLIKNVVIPDSKQKVYDLVSVLFDKFVLDQTKPDPNTPAEQAEVNDLVGYVYKSPPLAVARSYVEQYFNNAMSDDEWWDMIQRIWFRKFDLGSGRDLSGFEHVFIGEQKQATLNGYHFWYKYYLDEKYDVGGVPTDLITIVGPDENTTTADVVTLQFKEMTFSYKAQKFIPLFKAVGGFWVGPSPAGLLAIGVTAFVHGGQVIPTKINNVNYKVTVFKSNDSNYLRTCYPVYVNTVN